MEPIEGIILGFRGELDGDVGGEAACVGADREAGAKSEEVREGEVAGFGASAISEEPARTFGGVLGRIGIGCEASASTPPKYPPAAPDLSRSRRCSRYRSALLLSLGFSGLSPTTLSKSSTRAASFADRFAAQFAPQRRMLSFALATPAARASLSPARDRQLASKVELPPDGDPLVPSTDAEAA